MEKETEYPYQATIVGNEHLPDIRQRSKFIFLKDLATKLKPGQHVRLIVPQTIKKTNITSVWYSMKNKGKPHSGCKKNDDDSYTLYLWFGPVEPSATSKLLRRVN